MGSSVIRNIDATKLVKTQCISISGDKITDIRKKNLEFHTTNKLARAIIVVDGNDCDDQSNQQDASELLTRYKDLILSTKEVAATVTVSSICPQKRSPEVTKHISALNAGLRVLCDDMGTTLVNNNPSFHLQDGTLNDGYLLHDGN